jgi:hypothetical protein
LYALTTHQIRKNVRDSQIVEGSHLFDLELAIESVPRICAKVCKAQQAEKITAQRLGCTHPSMLCHAQEQVYKMLSTIGAEK